MSYRIYFKWSFREKNVRKESGEINLRQEHFFNGLKCTVKIMWDDSNLIVFMSLKKFLMNM